MTSRRSSVLAASIGLICAVSVPSDGLGGIVVTDVRIEGGQIRLEVFDNASGATDFRVQSSTGLDKWPKDFGAVITPDGPDRYIVTVPMGTSPRFFRVLGLNPGPGVDPDGDGLPTDYENNLAAPGPDPLLFDTDDDGYNDGREIALGTDPADPDSFPELDGLPALEFVEPISSFTEGDSPNHGVTLHLDQPYTGTLYYTVNARSTAAAPDDYAVLSGSVFVGGTTATIDIAFADNQVISSGRILILDLDSDPPGGAYRLGGRSTHLINLSDNDIYWNGSLKGNLTERSFRLRILRQSGQATEVAFVAGGSDGLPDVDGGASSQATGVIPASPQEVWPAVDVIDTSTRFRAISPPLPVPAATFSGFETTSSITNEPLTRLLTLDADPGANPGLHYVEQDSRIVGGYTEQISPADPSKTFLNRTTNGFFGLVKDLPSSVEVESPFDPNN